MAKIKHTQVYRRPGEDDILLSFQTRDGDTDGLFAWNGTGWTLLVELPGTDLIYDSVVYKNQIFWADGKNPISLYSADTNETCEVETAPVVQYLIIYQDRLVGAGDARTQAEIEAAMLQWPADSNRDRVLFSEALNVTRWSPNNFIDANSGTRELVSGLGVNSITSSDRGAQSQLVVFKPTSILVNDGTLGGTDQRLSVVSDVLGCPGYHSIVNTPFGLMFASKETVCIMDFNGREPNQVGFPIFPEIEAIPDDMKKWTAAIFHKNTYKLSIAGAGSTFNNREWWLDLRPQIFPNEHNWYGPMTGDRILQYSDFFDLLVGAQMETTSMWELDVEGSYNSMTATGTPRTSTMIWPRLKNDNLMRGKLDAYGFRGVTDSSVAVEFAEEVDFNRGVATQANTFTIPARPGVYSVTRPVKRTSYDAQVSISHSADSDIEIHSVYVRGRQVRRQSEKDEGSSQG